MAKLNTTPRVNVDAETARWMREIANAVNGTWAQGDRVRNSTPSEAGAAASKYVVTGWICTVAGTPGTWLPMRTLTGN